ncbi:MAG: glycosyltransferase family 4 protein [Armatimonadetes bacterium]|nr:glycosyltransferase family 4 protein [Armatimonadota bacterium]
MFRHADAAMAGSGECSDVLRRKKFKKPVHIVYPGVNPVHFFPWDAAEFRRKLGLSGFTIGYVGRLAKEKGLGTLMEAAAFLGEGVQLLLIGSGPDELELRRKARSLGISDRICWISSIDNTDAYRYYNAMDVLVLPSLTTPQWKEQFGRVLVEAMLCKTPVIGSSSGEIPTVIGDGGSVFPEGNVVALAGSLFRLRTREEYRIAIAEQGFRRAHSEYTFQRMAERTLPVFRSLMEGCLS